MGAVTDSLISDVQSLMNPEAFARNASDNSVNTTLLGLWISDAAATINRNRQKTTRKTFDLPLITGQNAYAFPTDIGTIVSLIEIVPARDNSTIRTPDAIGSYSDFGAYGGSVLPSGQKFTASLDIIRRQEMTRRDREVTMSARIFGGSLVIDQQTLTGTTVTITVEVEDSDVEELPNRHYDLVLTYLRYKVADGAIGRIAGRQVVANDGTGDAAAASLREHAADLLANWKSGLAQIFPEVS